MPPSCRQKSIVCVFSPGTNSEREMRSQAETPLLRWPYNELNLCGTGLLLGWEQQDRHSLLGGTSCFLDWLPGPKQSTETHGLVVASEFGMSGCNFTLQRFLAPGSLSETTSLILRGEVLRGPVSYLKHVRHFAGLGKVHLLQTWVIHVWLLTPGVSKKAILRGHRIPYQLF